MTGGRRRWLTGAILIAALGLVLFLTFIVWVLPTAQKQGFLGPAPVPNEFRNLIRDAAARCPAVPVEVFAAQMEAESGWDPQATSPSGARGVAQFMPDVWEAYGIDGNMDGTTSVWDPEDAFISAAELNCRNRRLVKDIPGNRLMNTLAAYNAGYGAVAKYQGVPPFPETTAYVKRILENAKKIQL